MKSWILTYCFIFFSTLTFSTKISGHTHKSFSGKIVNLIKYKDYITYEYDILTSSIIDTSGNFDLDINLKETSQFLLQIEDLIGIIYLDPSVNYNIYFPPYSADGTYKLTRNFVNIIFDSLKNNDINGLILEFDRRLDQFLEDNINFLGSPILKNKLDTLKVEMKNLYKDINNKYFLKYIKYSIAGYDLITVAKNQNVNRLSNYNVYLANKKVDYNHYSYMNFFNQFYEKEFLTPTMTSNNNLLDAINTHESYIALDTVLKKDYYFKNKKIRDLAIITNLFEAYDDERFSQAGILKILNFIKDSNKYDQTKQLAHSVIKSLTKMKVGFPAIEFSLKDQNNEKISLSDFKGKYVYINFWTTWSKESQAEMALYPQFIEKYGKHVEFISINIDYKKQKFNNFIANHSKYDWNLVYFDGNANLLDDYMVTNIPHYIFVDPNGIILQNPANRPSPNGSYISIDKTFFDLNKKLTKKKRWTVGGK